MGRSPSTRWTTSRGTTRSCSSFSSAIDLNKVTVGYISGDSDITVLAYTGAGTPTLAGNTYSSLTSQGWTFVGHYTDLALNTATAVNPTNIAAQYWLIGTYIPAWGTTTYSTENDYVKLLALYGDKPPGRVPEPNAALLLGLALVGRLGDPAPRGRLIDQAATGLLIETPAARRAFLFVGFRSAI